MTCLFCTVLFFVCSWEPRESQVKQNVWFFCFRYRNPGMLPYIASVSVNAKEVGKISSIGVRSCCSPTKEGGAYQQQSWPEHQHSNSATFYLRELLDSLHFKFWATKVFQIGYLTVCCWTQELALDCLPLIDRVAGYLQVQEERMQHPALMHLVRLDFLTSPASCLG
jgi:hypothetical protein